MSKKYPPLWALRLLRWYCREEYLDEIEGDLLEMHHLRASKSIRSARLFFMWNVLRSFRWQNIRKVDGSAHYLQALSIRQTFRYLRKEKLYTLLNTISLAVGFAFAIFYLWYASEETSYDQFHVQKESIYRVSFDQYLDLGPYATTPYPVGPALKKDFPEVAFMSRFASGGNLVVRYGADAFHERVNLVDNDFFHLFDFELLQGEATTVLDAPHKVVISERIAKKYFKDENPIGKELMIGSNGSYDALVTGVFRNVPANSQLQFDMLLSYSTLEKLYSWLGTLWTQMPRNYTYIKLAGGVSPMDFNDKIKSLKTYVKDLERGDYALRLMPLDEVHFYQGLANELSTNKDRQTLMNFGLVVLLVLSIGIINFINITASRYLIRIKEMGLRKVLGAERYLLVFQLLFQAFWVVLISLGLAWLLVSIFLPLFNDVAGKNFELTLLLSSDTIWLSATLLLLTTFIAGVTPALTVTSIDPAKGIKSAGHLLSSKVGFKKASMVVFQYAVTVLLLISSIVIFRQLQFLETSALEDQESTMVIPINTKIAKQYDVLASDLEKFPSIQGMAASSHVPSYYGDSWPVKTELKGTPVQTENFVITDTYLEVMSYELIAGRLLDQELESDRSTSFMLNETAVQLLGFASVEEALGKSIIFGSDNPKEGKVVGVVKDFHFEKLNEKIGPALFQFSPYEWMSYNFLVLNVTQQDAAEAIKIVESAIAKVDPKWVVDATFFDDHFRQLHSDEIRQGKLSTVFSVMAIILSCLGQLGLLLNLILSRRKELAIRKVLGAKVRQLWFLTTKMYIRFFFIAVVVSSPVAAYLMRQWLTGFYYHIQLDAFPFLLAGLIAGVTMISIISLITFRAATANPTESLSDE